MASERLQIEIAESGARVVRRNIEQIGAGARSAGGPVSELRGAVDRLTKVAREINSTLKAMNSSMLATRKSALESASAVKELNRGVAGNEQASRRASVSTNELARATGVASAAQAQLSKSATATTASISRETAATTSATAALTARGSAIVAVNQLSGTAAVTNLTLAAAEDATAAAGLRAAESQRALGAAIALLPSQTAAGVAAMAQLQAAFNATAAGGAGGGFLGGLTAGLAGFGDAARRVGGGLASTFTGAFAAAARGGRQFIGVLGQAASQLVSMRSLFAAAIGGAVVTGLVGMADSLTVIRNRLGLVTEGTANLNAVQKELFSISQDTRSAFTANAELYSRVALAAKDLGTSQRELLDFTKSLNQAIKLSGVTAQEAQAGLIQLSQGIASGTLRGDELRSVLEQLPAVADVIAKSLGVTRGELRLMGQEGKINAEVILKAFREAREELEGKFAKTVPTMAEGFTILKNELTVTVSELFSATGASSGLGSALASLAGFIRDLTPELLNFGRGLTGSLDPMDELSSTSKVFTTILVTLLGVLKLLATSLTTTVSTAFRTVGRIAGGVVAAIAAAIRGDFSEAGEILKTTWADTKTDIVNTSENLREELVGSASGTVEKLVQIWDKGARQIQDRREKALGEVSTRQGKRRAVGPSAEEIKERERVERQLERVLDRINPIPGATLEMARAQKTLTKARELGLLTDEQLIENQERLAFAYRDTLDPLGRINREIDDQIALLGLSAREREVEAQVLSITEQLLRELGPLTREETEALRERLTVLQQTNDVVYAQDNLLAQSVERRRAFADQLTAIMNLLSDPTSGFTQGDAREALVSGLGEDLFTNTAEMFQVQQDRYAEMYRQIEELRQKDLISEQTAAGLRAKIWAESQARQLDTADQFFGGLAQLQKSSNQKIARIGKAAAIAQALIDTYKSATSAYAAMAGIPIVGPALGVAAAAAAIAAGLANVRAIRSQKAGFKHGGYTGSGPVDEVAGPVHRREYVMDAATTARVGRGDLDALRAGKARVVSTNDGRRARGGEGTTLNVKIENHGTSKSFEVQQLSESDIRVIARDESNKQIGKNVPDLVSGELANPNSRISKAMVKNTQTIRRR